MFDKKKYFKEYYEKNKEKYKGYVKKYQQSEKGQEKLKKSRKIYNSKPEIRKKRIIHDREKYQKNPTIKTYKTINAYLKNCIRRYAKDGKLNVVNSTYNFYKIVYGIDIFELIDHLKPLPKHIENYEIDHIIPIRKFDLTDNNEIKLAYQKENLQLLTSLNNKKKR